MRLHVQPKTSPELQQAIIDEWLRYELKRAIPPCKMAANYWR
jgi:hypothetical protein